MTQKTTPGVTWEGLVHLFLEKFEIPSRVDISQIHQRLDRVENLIYQSQPEAFSRPSEAFSRPSEAFSRPPEALHGSPAAVKMTGRIGEKKSVIASDVVLNVIAEQAKGADFKTIKAATDYNDKKLRNIIFRLDKIGKIKRVKRGIYKKA
ncbi:MAG: hypothetical protein GY737_14950 [Desulfobacteraceae bacterium]|nr:hypothetical protein [Desulfobacteraceae bacterium]